LKRFRQGDEAMRPIEEFCCQNKECPEFGKKGRGNLSHRGWSGHEKAIRMLYCSVCGAHFSERTGTVLAGCRLPVDKVVDIMNHLFEQNGIRQTARLTGVDKNTVNRLAKLAGEHAEKVHEELLAFSPEHPRGSDGRKVVVRP
jgi:hypothetical protein